MIVDFHVHTFPDAFAAKTVAALSRVSRTRPFTDGTAAALQASIKRAGVDRSVLLPVATKPAQVPGINDAAAQINSRGEGGLLSFGGIHPEFADWRSELDRIAALGIPGIWVLICITAFGAVWGILGILVGVPAFAAVYRLLQEDMDRRAALAAAAGPGDTAQAEPAPSEPEQE